MFLNGMNVLAANKLFSESQPGQSLIERPLGFIDIGARGGAHDLVEPIAKYTAVLGFEPDQEECVRLMKNPDVYQPWANFVLKPVALADKKGEAELKLLSASTNHSLLSPNVKFTKRYGMTKWEEVGRCQLQTDTLDAVLYSDDMKDFSWGEFIKIDTQGTEYEILCGSKKVLAQQTLGVVTEVAFCELYQDQKLFSDVAAFMRDQGFSFYGFTNLHTRSKKLLNKKSYATRERLIYTDAIFLKDPLPGGYVDLISPRGCYALFVIALLLGFYDYALELAYATWLLKSDKLEAERIEQLIKQVSRNCTKKTSADLLQLVNTVKENPEWVNVAVGGFVDKRRPYCDYDDTLNVSPLPKTL
ncbi:MAG: hypothetical protein A3E85_02640 [Gammaproteobacteria bacterium RIFCSPHIGHO2_12_FULL_45_12]|nr:MAG: hypothetical protein A3E85_02640 [Gammaproteobacteria bacterium RIFCSPHIGHO2_12_FULL_45_12]